MLKKINTSKKTPKTKKPKTNKKKIQHVYVCMCMYVFHYIYIYVVEYYSAIKKEGNLAICGQHGWILRTLC